MKLSRYLLTARLECLPQWFSGLPMEIDVLGGGGAYTSCLDCPTYSLKRGIKSKLLHPLGDGNI